MRSYSAIIRTHGWNEVLSQVLACLKAQSIPPREIIAVNSASEGSEHLRSNGAIVVDFSKVEFNYSAAINVGVRAATSDNVLIISSHFELGSPSIIEEGLSFAESNGSEVVYWADDPLNLSPQKRLIDRHSFNGYNGLSNVCAFIPRRYLEGRPFREEVFSAEDQEWASWYFTATEQSIARIDHPAAHYRNINSNERKVINEVVAVAYFVRSSERSLFRIIERVMRAILALCRGRLNRSKMHFEIAARLILMRFIPPVGKSRYF